MERILIIAPHADDELFGVGGTALRYKDAGSKIKCVLVACSDIDMHHRGTVTAVERKAEFCQSCAIISTEPPSVYGLQDSRLDQHPITDLVSLIEKTMASFNPTAMFIPEPSYHQDHRAVYQASIAALRPTGRRRPASVMLYEVPTSVWSGPDVQFRPNMYVELGDYAKEKEEAFMDAYHSQYSKERGALAAGGMIKHAMYRGVECGVKHAEAFQKIYELF